MRNKKVKEIRKCINEFPEKILIIIRNNVGNKTKDMGPRQIYQTAKKLYVRGNLKLESIKN